MEEEGEEEDEFDEEKEAAAVLAEVQSESAQISVNVARYTVTVGTAEGAQGHTVIAPPYVGEEMFESSEHLVGLCHQVWSPLLSAEARRESNESLLKALQVRHDPAGSWRWHRPCCLTRPSDERGPSL